MMWFIIIGIPLFGIICCYASAKDESHNNWDEWDDINVVFNNEEKIENE